MLDVSIIFVSYNTEDYTIDAIKSVVDKTENVSYEIIVVDNNSHDNTVDRVKKEFPFVNVIENKENFGFGYANNIGASFSKGRLLFLLNTDTLLINNAIGILCDFLSTNREICAVGPNIFDTEGNPTTSYSKLLPSFLLDFDELLFNLSAKFKFINFNFNYSNKSLTHRGSISGAAVLIRKSVFDQVGGFDKRFFLYYEETDLFRRITKECGLLASEPRAKIIHFEGGSESIKEVTLHRSFKSKYIYLDKHHSTLKSILHHINFNIIALSRVFIFKLLGNKGKVIYWCLLRKVENDEYKKFKKD